MADYTGSADVAQAPFGLRAPAGEVANHQHSIPALTFGSQAALLATVKGTGQIVSGQTTVTITHGLGATPTMVTVTFTAKGTAAVGQSWVSSIGATTFVVNVTSDPTSTLTFIWEAKA